MLVVEPAPKPPASATPSAPLSSYNTPVHIDIDSDDDDSSSTTDDEELIERQDAAQTNSGVGEEQRGSAAGSLEIETNGDSVLARAAPLVSQSPVSRLNGYAAAGADVTPSESTSSSPHSDRRRSHGVNSTNAAFFKSVRKDLWTRPSPTKATLKRPLVLHRERRQSMQGRVQSGANSGDLAPAPSVFAGNSGSVPSAQKVISESPERKSNPKRYKSSSDSSDLDEEDEEEEEKEDEDHEIIIPPPAKKLKPDAAHQAPLELDFFMRPSQVPFVTDLERVSAAQNVATAMAAAAQQSQQHMRICSSRTRICGQVFGRCELVFSDRSIELVLWRQGESGKRVWQGTLKYAHLRRFCFHRGAGLPPYLLLLEVRSSEEASTPFSEFYDSIFAKYDQEQREVPKPNLYGAAFYFDEEVAFARCQSMVESFPALSDLFNVQISDEEAVEYFDSEVNGGDGNCSRSSSWILRGHQQQSSSIHSATSEKNGITTTKSDRNAPARNDHSIAKFFRRRNQESVVEIEDPSQSTTFADESEEKKSSGNDEDLERKSRSDSAEMLTKSQARDAVTQALETKRNTTLLTYPYEDSESAVGKISVTYGDIARLAPGEFLNDNIIDFYLRFYWRHIEPWRQELTYFYSSHFFTQLNGGNANMTAEERFARVSRWTQKETDLFTKQFLFIPINDSFHWSIAVFCNPGSAITMKRRKIRQVIVSKNGEVSARRPISVDSGEPMIVDLVDPFKQFRNNNSNEENSLDDSINDEEEDARGRNGGGGALEIECDEVREEYYEEDLENHSVYRKEHPPCLLFLDSLKCHRKKKFTAMLREYLANEWKNRHGSDDSETIPTGIDDESIVSQFDPDAITLLEPDIPMQTNSSDCGVFLLMYAAEVARRFPAGITQEDVETQFAATLTSDMFDLDHVQEFRDYLHQLIFCLHSLQKRGLSEELVKDEELDSFFIER